MNTKNQNTPIGKFCSTNEIVLIFADKTVTCNSSNPRFADVRRLVTQEKYDEAVALANTANQVNEAFAGTSVEVRGNQVFHNGQPIHNVVVDRILAAVRDRVNATPIVRFLERVLLNPSYTAVQELYLFLECNSIPLTEDGHFLAWKKVRHDFRDIYTGKLDYSPGKTVTMPRNEVDENRERTCSQGLHCAGWSYLPCYGSSGSSDRIVIVKVDPADVVSVPSDYKNAKMRCAKMVVLREYTDRNVEAAEFSKNIVGATGEIFEEDDVDEDIWNDGYEKGVADALSGRYYNPNSDDESYCEGYDEGYEDYSGY